MRRKIYTIVLPMPPSTNTYWRHTEKGSLISAKGRAFRKHVAQLVMVHEDRRPLPIEGELIASVEIFPPDKRERDLDNFAGKALYDALENAGVFLRDSQVKEAHHYMRPPDKQDPRAVVTLVQRAILTDKE